ncbi:MAG: serine/threonine-protein kinase [Leptolyngbya sp.]|nr:serine/threonine-protein kinase [Leptolyngbya sp.]
MESHILGGRYRILHHLGGGGFGQTYLAEDRHLPGNPRCVVKRLQPRTTDPIALESARRLFDAEAEALYELGTHDQIPRLLAHFEENAQFYLVQELIEGTLLTEEIHPGHQVPEADVVALLQDILATLCVVHRHQVIHRDIKPSNLIRRHQDGKIVIIDFGSVKQVSSQPIEENGQVSITVAIGSLGYMPNEQLAGQPTLSSDIYAVGMLALQALTGLDPRRMPKDPRTSELVWRELVTIQPPLAELIDKMVRYDFRQRYWSAIEAYAALQTAIAPTAPVPQPTGMQPPSSGVHGVQVPLPVRLENHQGWLEQADDLFQNNRFREALPWYEKVVQLQPDAVTAWFKLALVQENLDRLDAAVVAYDRVLQLQPEDYLAWLKRGNALEKLGRLEGAMAAYQEVLRMQPDNYWVWNDLGQVQERLNQLEDAIAAYNRAVQLKPDFQLALENRKRLLIALKRVDQLYTLNHYEETITACDQAVAENPNNVDAWLMRGMALENLKRMAEAALSYNRVVQIQPEDHVTWFKLGSLLDSLHRPQQAAIAFGNVVRLQPGNHWAWHQRGRMLEQLSQNREAIAAYQKALQIKPDYAAARDAYQHLLHQSVPATSS